MKVLRRVILLLFVFSFPFVPSLSPLFLERNYQKVIAQEEDGVISGFQEWTNDKEISSDITIESGATLVIKKGVKVIFNGGRLNVEGKLFVKGTSKENVLFKNAGRGGTFVNIWGNGEAFITGADISGAGGMAVPAMKDNLFVNALAWASGAINVNGGKLTVENSSIHDNFVGIYVSSSTFPGNVKVNRSKFFNNSDYDALYDGYEPNPLLDFKYNWWGKSDGPRKIDRGEDYGRIMYRYLSDGIDFSSWLTQAEFRDPVIIIPGILGSQKEGDQWQIDPVWHMYDNLYQELADNGYVAEKDLFTFPYEWRDSNVDNAKLLRDKINQIKRDAKWPKVDIVAHSMGGLLAREYVESSYYQDDVDQLITLGTPHNGAPEAYLKWEGNAWMFGVGDMYAKHFIDQETEEGDYADGFDYLHQRPVASLEELLPVYNYLQDVKNGDAYKNYPIGYPCNEFLENLNSDNQKEKLNYIEFDKIIGNLDDTESTISGVKIIETDMGKFWQHGYPHNFNILVGDRGLIYGNGDETVPIESARSENIPSDYSLEINSGHRELPTEAQKDVLELLTGIRPEGENRDSLIKDILLINVFSPVDIQIVDPNNRRVGKNFTNGEIFNEIDGAYYSGYETDSEFIAIPNPEEGKYQILTRGTGGGEFRVEATKIIEGDEDSSQEATESTAVFRGTTSPSKNTNFVATVDGDSVINPNLEITSADDDENNDSRDDSASILTSANNTSSESSSDDYHKSKKKRKSDKKNEIVATTMINYPIIATPAMTQIQEALGVSARQYSTEALEGNVYAEQGGISFRNRMASINQKIMNFFSWLFSLLGF